MRVAIYARYSSHLQNERSVDDQIAVCEERCAAEGWTVVRRYFDKAISGKSMVNRPGLLDMLEAAQRQEFDLVVAESLDRISRDQEETAGINKRLKFANVAIHTLSEGRINEMHVGLKGTMNALELQQTAARVRRGQLGSVREGKLPGGKAYGYRTIRTTDNPTGLREKVPEEAAVIRRIFADYNAGMSPIAIAKKLNAEGIPGPSGRAWRHTTITGSRKRMTGILRNPLYVGKMVWGRSFNVHNPVTGRRLMRGHDSSKYFSIDASDFSILDEESWAAAQKRLAKSGGAKLAYRPRPRHLLSGLVRCEKCGGPFAIENRDRLRCSNQRNKGMCTVSFSISRGEVEKRVLDAIVTKLSDPEIIEIYREEYIRERKEKMKTATDARPSLLKREADLKVKLDRLTEHMVSEELNPAAMAIVRQQINKAAEDLQIVQTELAQSPAPDNVEAPSNFADRLAQQLPNLRQALEGNDKNAAAAREVLRSMINEIRVQPTPGAKARVNRQWDITVSGPIQAVLEMPEVPDFSEGMGSEGSSPLARRGLMVAPDGFEPPTKGL